MKKTNEKTKTEKQSTGQGAVMSCNLGNRVYAFYK